MKNIILLLPLFLASCTSLHINYEEVQNIDIIFDLRSDLRDSPLEVSVQSDGIKRILIRKLNESKKSYIPFAIKEALEEGQYEIHIKYKDKETKDVFNVANSEDIFLENNETLYKNKKLLNFLRSLLFRELAERKIKLNDVTQ